MENFFFFQLALQKKYNIRNFGNYVFVKNGILYDALKHFLFLFHYLNRSVYGVNIFRTLQWRRIAMVRVAVLSRFRRAKIETERGAAERKKISSRSVP